MSKHIPNLLTISNLICGCIALYFTFHGKLVFTAYLIGLAAVFDFMDGAAARLLYVSNPIGKELDSLADMVSFGLVPGSVVFHILEEGTLSQYSFMALLIPIFSAYRLAKFNVDENQNENFIGLPTPANCLVFVSIPLITTFNSESTIAYLFEIPEILLIITILMSLALVSRINMFSLKFKNFKFQDNKFRFFLITMSIILLTCLEFSAIPLIILLYILMSIVKRTN
ncbi:MAG: CDP-diacylglycerol--serine O-phosphatidyltransferase [Bacteroidetes bacterium MED-G21]|nr:MAG: CDP-diacylglycerol--serine O-phosphatidyltransferase [Bacteroidetes bacterium MED-G21]